VTLQGKGSLGHGIPRKTQSHVVEKRSGSPRVAISEDPGEAGGTQPQGLWGHRGTQGETALSSPAMFQAQNHNRIGSMPGWRERDREREREKVGPVRSRAWFFGFHVGKLRLRGSAS
jgi:hypothetical protein